MQAESGSHVVWMCLADEDDDDEDYYIQCVRLVLTLRATWTDNVARSSKKHSRALAKPSVFAILPYGSYNIYASLINRFCG